MLRDLTLEKVIFEVKYKNGFLYWDRCGSVWRDVSQKWPGIKMLSVAPEKAQFVLEEQAITFMFNHNLANISQDSPADLKFFTEFTQYTIPLVTERFEVSIYDRIGNRFIYMAPMEQSEQAIELLKRAQLLTVPSEKLKTYGETFDEPAVKIILKGKDVGYIIRVSYMTRELEVMVPKPVKFDATAFIKRGLSIDIDCYTLRPVDVGVVDSEDLIKINERNVRKMIADLFGGI